MRDDARTASVCGVILAGGAGTRMGGRDKGFVDQGGVPLVARVLAALAPQVESVAISANRTLPRYAAYGWPVWRDDDPAYPGPLAGVVVALRRAAEPLVLTVPVDAPDLPADLAPRLARALAERLGAGLAVVHDGERVQPLFALYRRGVLDDVVAHYRAGERSVVAVQRALGAVAVDCSAIAAGFRNVNTPGDTGA